MWEAPGVKKSNLFREYYFYLVCREGFEGCSGYVSNPEVSPVFIQQVMNNEFEMNKIRENLMLLLFKSKFFINSGTLL